MKNEGGDTGWVDGEVDALLDEQLITPDQAVLRTKFKRYLSLILRWNIRINLTSIRDPRGIVKRHFLESIRVAHLLPGWIRSLLDFGSGAGFPGIPIALCRPEMIVTLAESQSKKAAFLQEAVRSLDLNARVWSQRAEEIQERFDCVAMRAVDRMEAAVPAASRLVRPTGLLVLLTTQADLSRMQAFSGPEFQWQPAIPMPESRERLVVIGSKTAESL